MHRLHEQAHELLTDLNQRSGQDNGRKRKGAHQYERGGAASNWRLGRNDEGNEDNYKAFRLCEGADEFLNDGLV